jgi:hypothetical protein
MAKKLPRPDAPEPTLVGKPCAVSVHWQWERIGVVTCYGGRLLASKLKKEPAIYRISVEPPDTAPPDAVPVRVIGQAGNLRNRFDKYYATKPDEHGASQAWIVFQLCAALSKGWLGHIDIALDPEALFEDATPAWAQSSRNVALDTTRERLTIEGVAVATELGKVVLLNDVKSTNKARWLNDRNERLVLY